MCFSPLICAFWWNTLLLMKSMAEKLTEGDSSGAANRSFTRLLGAATQFYT